MIQKNKFFRQIIIFALLLCITFYLLLKDSNLDALWKLILTLQYRYVFLGIGIAIIYVLCESVAFKLIFNSLDIKTKFKNLARYSFIGFYFSAITPSASGGQPMQMYYMRKDNIPYHISSLAVLLCVCAYQVSLILFFIVSFLFQFNHIGSSLNGVAPIIIIAFVINTVLLLIIFGMIFSKKLLPNIIHIVFKALKKIPFLKRMDEKEQNILQTMDEYHRCTIVFKEKPLLLVKILGIYLLQLTLRFSISYVAAIAMHVENVNLIDFIMVQSMILFCVSSLPMPGGIGISESLYVQLFSFIIPAQFINAAALLTQGMNYYSIVIISAIVVIYSYFKYSNK